MNPMQAPNVGPGGRDFGNRDQYMFRVIYTIPPTRAIKTAEFEEFAQSTSKIEEILKEQYPSWKILRIERGIKSA